MDTTAEALGCADAALLVVGSEDAAHRGDGGRAELIEAATHGTSGVESTTAPAIAIRHCEVGRQNMYAVAGCRASVAQVRYDRMERFLPGTRPQQCVKGALC